MNQQNKLDPNIFQGKSYSLSKVLEDWFGNKNKQSAFYRRSQQGLIKVILEAKNSKQANFKLIFQKLKKLQSKSGTNEKQGLSKKQQQNLIKNLEQTTNLFYQQINQYEKQLERSLQQLKALQKQRMQIRQKQNKYLRNMLIQAMKNRFSLKEIFVLGNFQFQQASKYIQLIKQFKQIIKANSSKQEHILNSLITNLIKHSKQSSSSQQEIELLVKQVENLLLKRQIQLTDVMIKDPVKKSDLIIKAEELQLFLSVQKQKIIQSSNIEGLQTSFLNQMQSKCWVNVLVHKDDDKSEPSYSKIIVTKDGWLIVVSSEKIIEYQLRLQKIQFKLVKDCIVNVSKSKNVFLKLFGLENQCNLKFKTQLQCQNFIVQRKEQKSNAR